MELAKDICNNQDIKQNEKIKTLLKLQNDKSLMITNFLCQSIHKSNRTLNETKTTGLKLSDDQIMSKLTEANDNLIDKTVFKLIGRFSFKFRNINFDSTLMKLDLLF